MECLQLGVYTQKPLADTPCWPLAVHSGIRACVIQSDLFSMDCAQSSVISNKVLWCHGQLVTSCCNRGFSINF